jgi:hypothetical protein
VEANAAKQSRIPREQLAEAAQVHHTVRQYLKEVEEQNPVEEPVHQQEQVSTTDPDSTYATKGSTPARLGYCDNYLARGAVYFAGCLSGRASVDSPIELSKVRCRYR